MAIAIQALIALLAISEGVYSREEYEFDRSPARELHQNREYIRRSQPRAINANRRQPLVISESEKEPTAFNPENVKIPRPFSGERWQQPRAYDENERQLRVRGDDTLEAGQPKHRKLNPAARARSLPLPQEFSTATQPREHSNSIFLSSPSSLPPIVQEKEEDGELQPQFEEEITSSTDSIVSQPAEPSTYKPSTHQYRPTILPFFNARENELESAKSQFQSTPISTEDIPHISRKQIRVQQNFKPTEQQELNLRENNNRPKALRPKPEVPEKRAKKPVAQVLRRYREDNPDGSITWGFENDDGSYKEEIIGTDCITRGKYGYVDPDGVRREYEYTSGIPCNKKSEEAERAEASNEHGYVDYSTNKFIMPNGQSIDLEHMVKNRARKPVNRYKSS